MADFFAKLGMLTEEQLDWKCIAEGNFVRSVIQVRTLCSLLVKESRQPLSLSVFKTSLPRIYICWANVTSIPLQSNRPEQAYFFFFRVHQIISLLVSKVCRHSTQNNWYVCKYHFFFNIKKKTVTSFLPIGFST